MLERLLSDAKDDTAWVGGTTYNAETGLADTHTAVTLAGGSGRKLVSVSKSHRGKTSVRCTTFPAKAAPARARTAIREKRILKLVVRKDREKSREDSWFVLSTCRAHPISCGFEQYLYLDLAYFDMF